MIMAKPTPITIDQVRSFLITELGKNQPIARAPVPDWPYGVKWEDAPKDLQEAYRRRNEAGDKVSRIKTILGHLRAIYPIEK